MTPSLRKISRRPAGRTRAADAGKRPDIARIVQGLRRMVKALHTFSKDVYAHYGLTGPQLWALKTLGEQGPLPVGQLAAALAVHQSSASLLVTRLVRKGLIRRVSGGTDRRVVGLELTKRGGALIADAPDAAQGRLLHGLESMSPAEVKVVRQAVDRLVEAMEVQDVKARFFFSDT